MELSCFQLKTWSEMVYFMIKQMFEIKIKEIIAAEHYG